MATTTDVSTPPADSANFDGHVAANADSLSGLLKSKSFWRAPAPKGIASKDSLAVWAAHLKKRRTPKSLHQLSESTASPLRWGLNLQALSPRTIELIPLVDQFATKKNKTKRRMSDKTVERLMTEWLAGSHSSPQSLDFALECLVIANVLPQISEQVSPKLWWELADALSQIVDSASSWRSDAELPPEQGLAQQLLAGELPLTLAYYFPELRPLTKLRNAAHEAITEGINELTNGNGLVQGEYLGYQQPLLACWTRCHLMGSQLKKGCCSRKATEQFQWMVTHALGLSSQQGQPVLGSPHQESWTADFLRTVVRTGGDEADAAAAKSIFGKKLASGLKAKVDDPVPESSTNCEWAGVAYMRTQWERDAPLVAIDYSSPDMRIECWSGGQQLVEGTWSWETTLNGKRIEPVGTWDESCWFTDDDVDYLELSMDLTDGATLERQILLARDEMFLLLCDYVTNTAGGELSHRYRLPLAAELELELEQETREGLLTAGKTYARVLPLALPEWRVDPRVGQLTTNNNRLQLEQKRNGVNLACPLLIDLKRSRAKKECTWRQLTVAQSLEIQTPDVAVGYRAQCGKDQWLIYRSLAEPANRTVLGQNLSNECLIARFLAPEGEVDELLEIE